MVPKSSATLRRNEDLSHCWQFSKGELAMNHCCAICRDGLSSNPTDFAAELNSNGSSSPLNAITGTPCRHVFHCYCLAKWLDFQESARISPSCPACREPVPLIDMNGNKRPPKVLPDDVDGDGSAVVVDFGHGMVILAATAEDAVAVVSRTMESYLEENEIEFQASMEQRELEFQIDMKRCQAEFEAGMKKNEKEFCKDQEKDDLNFRAQVSRVQYCSYSLTQEWLGNFSRQQSERKGYFEKWASAERREHDLDCQKRRKQFDAWKKECAERNKRYRSEFSESIRRLLDDISGSEDRSVIRQFPL